MLENEDDDLNADVLYNLLARIDGSITFEEVWVIAEYLLSDDDAINFNEFMYAISANAPSVGGSCLSFTLYVC